MEVSNNRLQSLDSLRGLAAFVVVLSHCYLTWPEDLRWQLNWIRYTPLRILVNGHACVIIFFVLSGYVLALPFFRNAQPPYLQYLIKRFCRIYIPFAVSVFIAAILYWAAENHPTAAGGSNWFMGLWQPGLLTPATVFDHLLMTGTEADMGLSPVMWSLVYELRISIIFPLLIMLSANTRYAAIAGIAIFAGATLALILSGDADQWLTRTSSFPVTFLITIRFIPFFLVGILLSKHREYIRGWMNSGSPKKPLVLAAIAVVAFLVPHEHWADMAYGIGASALIVLAVDPRFAPGFEHGVFNWLGHISYSLYLLHLPILLLLFHRLLGVLPFGCIALIVIVTSLAGATLMNLLVERPAMQLGRRLTGKRAVVL